MKKAEIPKVVKAELYDFQQNGWLLVQNLCLRTFLIFKLVHTRNGSIASLIFNITTRKFRIVIDGNEKKEMLIK